MLSVIGKRYYGFWLYPHILENSFGRFLAFGFPISHTFGPIVLPLHHGNFESRSEHEHLERTSTARIQS
jgi:hypothetical protein